MLKYFCALLMAQSLFTVAVKAQTYNVNDFGAIADGTTVCTVAIQKTIDACNAKGGGKVYVPVGTWVTGTIHLKSNVNLYLESGAVLQGSPNLKDYESYTMPVYGLNYYGMLFTKNAQNVSITGLGTIDGNNKVFFDFNQAKKIDANAAKLTRQKENYRHVESGIGDGPVVPNDRPRQMVVFSDCSKVTVQDVSLNNSPFWTLHFADCDAVTVTGIKLWSGLLVPNADGIDVTSCTNVIITNCDIRAGDDAIAIVGFDHHFEIPGFSGKKHLSENIIVSNCNLQSSSSGIRIGFLDQNTVKNVHVSHVNITNATRGIGIFLRDEGSLQDMFFDDINIETRLRTGDWWGNGEPIHISAVRGKENVKLGTISNINFNNITCAGENGILVYGSDESIIHDLTFQNIKFKFNNSPLNGVAGGNIDLRGALRDSEQLFQHDIPGFYATHVDGLHINNFDLKWDSTLNQPYFTNSLQVNDFKNVSVKNFTGYPAPNTTGKHTILLQNGTLAETNVKNYKLLNVSGFKK